MQFHLNGFHPGDPEIFDPAERVQPSGAPGSLPEEVDVLIVGCGPAGSKTSKPVSSTRSLGGCWSARPTVSRVARWRCFTPTASASAY